MGASGSVTGSPTPMFWSELDGLPDDLSDQDVSDGPDEDQADVPVLMKKLFDPKGQRRRLASEVAGLAEEITCPAGQFGCVPSFKDLMLQDMELLDRHMQRLESQHKDKAFKSGHAGSEAAESVPSLPDHDFSDDFVNPTKLHREITIKIAKPRHPFASMHNKASEIPEHFEVGVKHGHVEGSSPGRDLVVNGIVAGGALTAAAVLTDGVAPIVVEGVHLAAEFAEYALPAVDAFLENNPFDNVTEDAVRCMGNIEDCHPRYLGLAVKASLEGVKEASHVIDRALEVTAKPVKKMLDNVGVTDESIGQLADALLGKADK